MPDCRKLISWRNPRRSRRTCKMAVLPQAIYLLAAFVCFNGFALTCLAQTESLDEIRSSVIEGRSKLRSCCFEANMRLEKTVKGVTSEQYRTWISSIDFPTDSWRQMSALPVERERRYGHLPKSLCYRIWTKFKGREAYWIPPNIFQIDFENAPPEASVQVLDPRLVGLVPTVEFRTGKDQQKYASKAKSWLKGDKWEVDSTTVVGCEITINFRHKSDTDSQKKLVVDVSKDFAPTVMEVYQVEGDGSRVALLTSTTNWDKRGDVWLPTKSFSQRRTVDGSTSESCLLEFDWKKVNEVLEVDEFDTVDALLPIGTALISMSSGKPVEIGRIGEGGL